MVKRIRLVCRQLRCGRRGINSNHEAKCSAVVNLLTLVPTSPLTLGLGAEGENANGYLLAENLDVVVSGNKIVAKNSD
jgi:hypothetical protein